MIGMLLPFVWLLAWYLEKEKLPAGVNYIMWIVECAALVLLVNTFSRWAILAGIGSVFAFGYIAERHPISAWRGTLKSMKNTWLRSLVLVISLIVAGAWERFLIAAQGDRSVLNRLTLWTGGLKMIADRPLAGWGDGSAGLHYDNWYQDLSSHAFHGTMVNSYLNIAVERGLPVLGIILFVLLLNIFLSNYLAKSVSPAHKGLLGGAAAIVVFFALVNVGYSTIYYVLPIVALAVAVLIITVFCVQRVAQTLFSMPNSLRTLKSGTGKSACATLIKPLALASLATVICVFSLYLGGVHALRNERIRVACAGEGVFLVSKSESSRKASDLTIAPDYSALGVCYGRSIRNLLAQNLDNFDSVRVLAPETDFNRCVGEKIIVMGARAKDWGTRVPLDGQRITFVCPTAPPAGQIKIHQLFLPRTDRWHVVEAWKNWAEKNECPYIFLMSDGILNDDNMRKILEYSNKP